MQHAPVPFRAATCNKHSGNAFRFADSSLVATKGTLVVRQLSVAIAAADADKRERLRVDAENQSLREQARHNPIGTFFSRVCVRVRVRLRLRLCVPASA